MGRIVIDNSTDILGVIDVQPTFMPGGELPVPDGAAVVPIINMLLRGIFDNAFASQDWHPLRHISFASTHDKQPFSTISIESTIQTLWPDHAVQDTPNAALHPDLDQSRIELVVRKGFRPDVDSYSAFMENDRRTSTWLDVWLRIHGFRRIFLTGLATDYCVGWTAEDGVTLGFDVVVIEDACRGIGLPATATTTSTDIMRDRLQKQGVKFVNSSDLTVLTDKTG